MSNPNNGLSLGVKQFHIDLMEPPTNEQIPHILGYFVIGQTVTADAGNWEQNDLTFSFQFNDGSAGSTQTYTIQPGDENTGLQVTVQATNRLGTVEVKSRLYTIENLTNTQLPTLSGDFMVGEEIVADPGLWNLPNSELDFLYSFNGGQASSSNTYTLQEGDDVTGVVVEVTAASNAETASATSETYDVEPIPAPAP